MKKYLIIISLILSAWTSLADAQLEAANDLYIKNKYQDAAKAYEAILNSGLESHELYFNLGNTYYKLGQNTKAIVQYERALLLEPGDEATLENLQFANLKVVDKVDAVPEFVLNIWFRELFLSLSTGTWAVLSMVFFAVSLGLLSLYLLSANRSLRKLGFSTSILTIFLTIFFILMASKHSAFTESHNSAIVMTPSLNVLSAPNSSSTELFVVHEGTKLRILSDIDDWYEISLANGSIGWVRHADVEPI